MVGQHERGGGFCTSGSGVGPKEPVSGPSKLCLQELMWSIYKCKTDKAEECECLKCQCASRTAVLREAIFMGSQVCAQ